MTWVHDRIFAAGGDHIPDTWRDFADQTGVTCILHLRPGRPTAFLGGPPELFLWLDVEEEGDAGEEERWLAGQFLLYGLSAGRSILIHSSLGRHRTRWAFVAYSICAGASVSATLRRAAEPPWLAPYHTDEQAWVAFAELARERGALDRA